MIKDYTKQHIAIKLSEESKYYFNYNYWRLLICKWVYHPKGDCERFANKVKQLIREVGIMELGR